MRLLHRSNPEPEPVTLADIDRALTRTWRTLQRHRRHQASTEELATAEALDRLLDARLNHTRPTAPS